jgi:hypothetical protein
MKHILGIVIGDKKLVMSIIGPKENLLLLFYHIDIAFKKN